MRWQYISTFLLIISFNSAWAVKPLAVHVCDTASPEVEYPDSENPEERLRKMTSINCRSFPYAASIKNPEITIPNHILSNEAVDIDKDAKYHDQHLNLEYLSADVLQGFEDLQLQQLLNFLAGKKVKVKWKDINKHNHKHSQEMNAAAAVALKIGMERHQEMLSRMLRLSPKAILPLFEGSLAVFIDHNFVNTTIFNMLHSHAKETEIMAIVGAQLIAHYTRFWSQKDPKNLTPILTQLVLQASKMMHEEETLSLDVRSKGILLGVLLSGSLKFAMEIKTKDERRIWIINLLSNSAWAATAFMGAIPMAGNIISAVAGVTSIFVVLAAALYAKDGPRDFGPSVKEIEGKIELHLLNNLDPRDSQKQLDALMLCKWMGTILHVNGFSN